MPFKNTNKALGIPELDKFQVGRSDVDAVPAGAVEKGVQIPWVSDSKASWVYYDCSIEVLLDSGVAVHHRLPQAGRADNTTPVSAFDTLSTCDLDDARVDEIAGPGINLKCQDQYQDVVQRMAHARYWFNLRGEALRFGYRIPIPGIKTIGGVPAIPHDKNPQRAFNRMFPGGNYSGVPLWHARWSLWYTTAVPPTGDKVPAVDLAGHISGSIPPPKSVQAPYSQPDDNARRSAPPIHG